MNVRFLQRAFKLESVEDVQMCHMMAPTFRAVVHAKTAFRNLKERSRGYYRRKVLLLVFRREVDDFVRLFILDYLWLSVCLLEGYFL